MSERVKRSGNGYKAESPKGFARFFSSDELDKAEAYARGEKVNSANEFTAATSISKGNRKDY